jgi:hypothetical protein
MLRDANYFQVSQKFSFIESLSLSRAKNRHSQSNLGKLHTDRAFSFQQQKISNEAALLATQTEKKTQTQASAIVTTTDTATTIDTNWYQITTDYSLNLAEIIHATGNHYVEPNSKSSLNSSSASSYLGKILFALACSYSLFAVWWLFGHQGHNLLTALTGGQNIVLSKSDVEFIDYMERSLEQIDRQVTANKKTSEEVVYVPVYTPAPAVPNIASNNLPLALPSSSISDPPPLPAPAEPLAIPEPPPLPAPTPITPITDNANNPASIEQTEQVNQSNQSNQTQIATKPNINHILIGVLELGSDRSAALVKVQGQTRRVWVGEEINTDGWILESISNQRANISYQGEVRSISVGETF